MDIDVGSNPAASELRALTSVRVQPGAKGILGGVSQPSSNAKSGAPLSLDADGLHQIKDFVGHMLHAFWPVIPAGSDQSALMLLSCS